MVGRKGSGKTALFVQLRDAKRSRRANIVVDLKPDGYQLVKLKERVLDFLTEGAQQHLITALWEYILLLEILPLLPLEEILGSDAKGLFLVFLSEYECLFGKLWSGGGYGGESNADGHAAGKNVSLSKGVKSAGPIRQITAAR